MPPSSASPTWYDVLGVSRDATAEEIKAAWRQATDRFEPGSASSQFRMYNDAAEVLLDPDRRREYDGSLEPGVSEPAAAPLATAVETTTRPVEPAPAPAPVAEPSGKPRRSGPSWGVLAVLGGLNVLVLGVLALLTVAVLVTALLTGMKVHQKAAVGMAGDEAPAAAERAVKALFSYDYRTLDADRTRAQNYLSTGFAKTYLRNFDALEKQKDGSPGLAVQSKAVVTAGVQGSGLVDVNADGTVARVLVFVDLTSRKATGDPQVFQNRVAMTMVKQGDRWVVDKVDSY